MAAKIEKAKAKIWQRKGFLVSAAVVALIVVFYGVNEFNYQQKVNSLKSAVDNLGETVTKSGGKKDFYGVFAPYWINQFSCIDTGPCPRATGTWFAQIQPGEEAKFMADTLREGGFRQTELSPQSVVCEAAGYRNNAGVILELNPITDRQPPYEASAGKEWRILSIRATSYPQ